MSIGYYLCLPIPWLLWYLFWYGSYLLDSKVFYTFGLFTPPKPILLFIRFGGGAR